MPACITPAIAMAGSSLISGGMGLAGASMQSNAALQGAQDQAQAAEYAAQLQQQMFEQIQGNLSPYMKMGQSGIAPLEQLMGIGQPGGVLNSYFGKPIPGPSWQPTMGQLAQTPGYQFALQQGLQATQNQFAGQGLGISGAETKGAVNYAEGLASTTYQQQFQNYLAQQQQGYGQQMGQRDATFGRLSGLVGSGQNAAAGLGQFGMQSATNQGQFLTSGAAATAGGLLGSANALAGGLGAFGQGLGGAATNYALLNSFGAGGGQGLFGNQFNAIENANPGYWETFGGGGQDFTGGGG